MSDDGCLKSSVHGNKRSWSFVRYVISPEHKDELIRWHSEALIGEFIITFIIFIAEMRFEEDFMVALPD